MKIAILVIFYVFAPLLILHLCHRFKFINKLGAVFIAYLLGLIVGNIGILPEGSAKVQDLATMLTIPLAIPLLLFSANIKEWKKLAKSTFLSLFIGVFSVTIIVVIGFFLFRGKGMPEAWKISGMLVGVYTGGTPNLAALKIMLNIDADTYVLTHTYDMAISVAYLAFLMTIGQKVFHLFLRPFPIKKDDNVDKDYDGKDPYQEILTRKKFIPILWATLISVIIFGIAGGLSLLVSENQQMVVVILAITTLSIIASLVPKINTIDKTFEAGMYLILIFSLVVASMADISRFAGLTPGLFGYITFAVFGSLLVHVLLSKAFKIDADTMMITSTALICSPPFVPVIAAAIGNKKVIVSGLTIGIIGYAIGNYLGYILAEVLKLF
ncbi:MAG: DUF819 family protein [Bacteroidales bacterium]|nr:DUF819 family protein [Bacteroidales bacterium]MDD4385257.1 DUF819 family protein [Bacteroidales bacterium]